MRDIPLSGVARRWLATVTGLALLHLGGRGTVTAPVLAGPSAVRSWAAARPAVETAIAVIRLLALAAGSYLLLILTIALVGRLARHRPTLLVASYLAPPGLRPLLALATTATIVASAGAAAAGAEGSHRPTAPPTLRWEAPPSRPPLPGRAAPPTLRWIGPAHATYDLPTTMSPGRLHPPSTPRPTPTDSRHDGPSPTRRSTFRPAAPMQPALHHPLAPAGPESYLVRPGDSFWSIATARLQLAEGGAAPGPEQVAGYWRRLVQANHTNLPVPGQPDLLFAGDRIDLPPVAST